MASFLYNQAYDFITLDHRDNTIGPTCAVDQADQKPYMQIPAVDRVYRQPFSLSQHPVSLVSFYLYM